MKLTVLVDNYTLIDHYYLGEPGLSFYIEDVDKNILFDTGYSDVVLQNAYNMQIDLHKVSDIVLSHGHNDHTRGLLFLKRAHRLQGKRVIAHPGVFDARFVDHDAIGSPMGRKEVNDLCDLRLTKQPLALSENLVFLGEIPNYFNFERTQPIGKCYNGNTIEDDYVLDDTAMAYRNNDGLFIITGCSHSGICNIIEHAKTVFQEDRISGVIGGFHLFKIDNQLAQTIDYFKRQGISDLYPCHCISFPVRYELSRHFHLHTIGVSSVVELS